MMTNIKFENINKTTMLLGQKLKFGIALLVEIVPEFFIRQSNEYEASTLSSTSLS